MTIGELITTRWIETSSLRGLTPLVLDHGVDLASGESPDPERGTPAYVFASADAELVQRRMAETHVRIVLVIDGDSIVGAVDLIHLIERADELVWEGGAEGIAR